MRTLLPTLLSLLPPVVWGGVDRGTERTRDTATMSHTAAVDHAVTDAVLDGVVDLSSCALELEDEVDVTAFDPDA